MKNINDILTHFYTNVKFKNYINRHLSKDDDKEEFKHFMVLELSKKNFDYYLKYLLNNKLDSLIIVMMRNNIKSSTSVYWQKYKKYENYYNVNEFDSISDDLGNERYSEVFENNFKKLSQSNDITDEYKDIILSRLRELYPDYNIINTKDWFNYKLFIHVHIEGYDTKYLTQSTGIHIDTIRTSLRNTKKTLILKIKNI